MAQGLPAAGEDGEAALAEGAQAAEQGVVGAGIDIQPPAVGWMFDGGVHADAGAGVAAASQRGQRQLGCRPVQRSQDVLARGGVVHRAGFDVGDPQRESVRGGHGLDVPPCLSALPEYHASICLPVTLVVCSPRRSAEKTLPSRIT